MRKEFSGGSTIDTMAPTESHMPRGNGRVRQARKEKKKKGGEEEEEGGSDGEKLTEKEMKEKEEW